MTEEQMIDCLLYELAKKDKAIEKKDIIIAVLKVMLCLVFVFGIALQNYHKPQITGLQSQLRRTQKQLKRASEDRARQTKRIAELTGNGG
ncbi:hypothetical protein [Streptococcus dysgalactiae]|uniref:hypothetical protein n=1 Tax=Streptococcus dysgalactiae TaxID=1334 RepID=UPI0024B7018F|nr:hypothetical protein [Streptococcus dysgalactiae]